MYLSVQTHEQKQFTKLCNYHWLTEKNWHLLTNLQDKTVMQGYGSESWRTCSEGIIQLKLHFNVEKNVNLNIIKNYLFDIFRRFLVSEV